MARFGELLDSVHGAIGGAAGANVQNAFALIIVVEAILRPIKIKKVAPCNMAAALLFAGWGLFTAPATSTASGKKYAVED
jgi:hypothetical protein